LTVVPLKIFLAFWQKKFEGYFYQEGERLRRQDEAAMGKN
jgi:hypothetical protein